MRQVLMGANSGKLVDDAPDFQTAEADSSAPRRT
jgi:hypothetical protein